MRAILFAMLLCGCGGAIETEPIDAGADACHGMVATDGACMVFTFTGEIK